MFSVKSVVRLAARMIGVEEMTEGHFNGSGLEEGERIVQGLVNCFNLVENELAVDYLPLVCEETLSTDEAGVIEYALLSKKIAYLIDVRDEWGNRAKEKRMPTHIKLEPGRYVVRYAALPTEKTAEDACEYGAGVSERLLAYGVAAEYCLHKGLYAEHAAWDKKYRDALAAACRSTKGGRLKERTWI
jgi:hypothetical protein